MMCFSLGLFLLNNLFLKKKTNYDQALSFVGLNKSEIICIYYKIILYILTHFMIILFYYQNALQTPTLIAELTKRLYSVHAARSQRANGALEDPTALLQRAVLHAVETPSLGVCFRHAQNKRLRMAF